MKKDLFESPKLLISECDQEIINIQKMISDFFSGKCAAVVKIFDPVSEQEAYKVRLTARLPGSINVKVKNVISNLRDALDHSVYSSEATIRGGIPKNTSFTFAKNIDELQKKLNKSGTSYVPPELRECFLNFRPYGGGNDVLWGMNQIRNSNTHRTIVPAGTSLGNVGMAFSNSHVVGALELVDFAWDEEKSEVEIFRVGRGSKLNLNIHVNFDAMFNCEGFFNKKPVVPSLLNMQNEVKNIISIIELETARFV